MLKIKQFLEVFKTRRGRCQCYDSQISKSTISSLLLLRIDDDLAVAMNRLLSTVEAQQESLPQTQRHNSHIPYKEKQFMALDKPL